MFVDAIFFVVSHSLVWECCFFRHQWFVLHTVRSVRKTSSNSHLDKTRTILTILSSYILLSVHNAQCTNTLSILIFILLHSLVIITVTHTHTHSHFVTIGICMCSNLYRTKSSEQSLKARKQKLIMLHVHCAVCTLSKQKSQHRQYSNKWQKVQ